MEVAGVAALEVAPPKAVCPKCNSESKRHSIRNRNVRDINLDAERIITIRVGVYFCATCDRYFRLQTGLAAKWKHYSQRAQDKSFSAVRDDKTTFTGLPPRLVRDFHITPSKSTCHRWFHSRADKIDFEKEYEPKAVAGFSGALAIDEVYDREFCLFFATDPLNRRPVSFRLCQAGNSHELEIFLNHLKEIGINPEVLIVDGSTLYFAVPQKVWPSVRIQSCVFHATKNCQEDLQHAIRGFHKLLPRVVRFPYEDRVAPEWWLLQIEQKVKDRQTLREYRSAFLTRAENLSFKQSEIVSELCERHPQLRAIRDFHSDLMALFRKDQSQNEAWRTLNSMRANTEYAEIPRLQIALKRLSDEKFEKMITFLDYENLEATTNHVERTNRWFRKRQKTHYRNRKERTIKNMLKADLGKFTSTHGHNLLRRKKWAIAAD